MKLLVLLTFILTMNINAYSVYSYIPVKAKPLLNGIYENVLLLEPDFPLSAYFPALMEKESCINLKWKSCFSPTARLHAQRKNGEWEEGAGLTQLTRVYRVNKGRKSTRFDTLTFLTRRYPKYLSKLTWQNVYTKPNLQIMAGMLLWFENYKSLKRTYGKNMTEFNLIAFSDAAYNGGLGGVRRDINKCRNTKGCNHLKWFGNVEKTCTKSKKKLYGNRSACDINRDHVRSILYTKTLKYHVYGIR